MKLWLLIVVSLMWSLEPVEYRVKSQTKSPSRPQRTRKPNKGFYGISGVSAGFFGGFFIAYKAYHIRILETLDGGKVPTT